MRIAFEQQDIETIADKVVNALKPMLSGKDNRDDAIFDIDGLCEYLQVTPKWIHERTHLKEMPYFKLSNKRLRFRKRDIDKWLESRKTPAINEYRGRMRG